MPQFPAEWLAEEYYADDANKLADVARSGTGVGTLHEATGGDPSGSPRWHRNMTLGGDQELIARLRACTGSRGSRPSTTRTSTSCGRWPRTWPRAQGGRCWWARPPTRKGSTRPAC